MRTSELWDEMMALERRLDDMFRGMVGPRARLSFPAMPTGLRRPFIPACDVFRKDKEIVVQLDIPGIDPDKDVQVSVEDGDLVIRGERRKSQEIKEEDFYRMETSYGAFERYITLPEGTKEGDVKAEYHDGLLEVHVPAKAKQAEAPKTTAIPIRASAEKSPEKDSPGKKSPEKKSPGKKSPEKKTRR